VAADWFDPEEALRRIQSPTVPGPYGPAPMPQVAEYGNTNRPVIDALAGAARGVASFLEPFQLPQDVMFSLLAGWRDPDKSAVDYFRGDQSVWDAVTAYAPGGDAPNRPASGEDILRLFGVEDARAAKWGGIALDLVADPLIAGAWLKGAGLAAKGMGFADTARDLARLGDRADYILSAAPIYRAIPAAARKGFEDRAFALAQATFNSRVFWNRAEDAKTLGDLVLPRRQALRFQMATGPEMGRLGPLRLMNSRADEAGRDAANFIARTEQTARSAGVTAQEFAAETAGEAMAALGGGLMTVQEQKGFVAHGMRLLGLRAKAATTYEGMPTVLRQYIAKEGWDILDQRGIAHIAARTGSTVEDMSGGLLRVPGQIAERAKPGADDLLRRFEDGVRARAKKVGYDPEDAWQRAQVFLQKASEADAMLGYHLSGYGPISRKFDDAAQAWFMREGKDADEAKLLARQTWDDALVRASKSETPLDTPLRWHADRPNYAKKTPTIRDMLEGVDTFQSLNLDTFMTGVFNGHMRRAFGVMQDEGTFRRYVEGVRDGKVFLSNVLDETFSAVPSGFEDEFALLKSFLSMSAPGGAATGAARKGVPFGARGVNGATRGTLVSRDAMFAHLIDNGVAPERARATLLEVIKQQNPHLARPGGVLDRLTDLGDTLAARVSSPAREGGTFGRGFFRAREDLTEDQMQLLGEFANPFISISETASKARSAVPFSVFMRETYDNAIANGFVRDPGDLGRFKDPVSGVRYVKIPEDEVGLWGAFAGKLVHPFLKKELLNAMKDRGGRVGTWARIRSLITGGYLASPNVILANMSGGFYQAAAYGLTPDVMAPSMARTLKKLIAYDEKGAAYDTIERLAKYFDLDDSTLIGQNFVREFKNLELDEAGLAAEGLPGIFNAVTDFMQNQLKRPGIGRAKSRWLGLDGFQFVERWFKVSAFEAEYARQLARGVADDVAERVAAEAARLVVFDYSELPSAFGTLRDYGLLMFPGFNYFLAPRTLRAAIQRPGVLSVSDRISDAINNAMMDEDEKYAVYASMPDWLRADQGAVVNKHEAEDGTMRYSAIPMNQLVPTNTFAGNPWGESLMSAGLWRPFIEALTAAVQGDGEALWSSRYGQRVFNPGDTNAQKASQTMQFLASNLMPGFVRKLGLDPASVGSLFDPTQDARGLIPKGI
jgi:hypothetical protein